MSIQQSLVAVMADVGAIKKGQENKFDRYKFRGIDDVYNALQPALVKHGVIVVPEVLTVDTGTYETAKGAVMRCATLLVKYHFVGEDGDEVCATVVGEGADRGDKVLNKAHSSAFKNALFQTLCIPTEERSDSEHESPEGPAPRKAAKPKEPESPGLRLFGQMKARCVEAGVDPGDYASGALGAIVRGLGVDKTKAKELLDNAAAIEAGIAAWEPPGDAESAGSSGNGHSLKDDPQALRGAHKWASDEFGLDAKEGHDLLHQALPEGVGSLSDLPVAQLAALQERARLIETGRSK